jgi:hypothetical protein
MSLSMSVVTVDVLPATLSPSDAGTVAVAILCDGQVDLGGLVLASLGLAGVAPVVASYNGGSVLLEFSAADVIQAAYATFGTAPHDGDSMTLELSGALLDGTLIYGADSVEIHVIDRTDKKK